MTHRTFFWFILPSVAAMVLFILVPLMNVGVSSFFSEPAPIQVPVESCSTNFLTGERTCQTSYKEEAQEGFVFRGLDYICGLDVLACTEIAQGQSITDLRFYRALGFTLFYTFITLPFVIVLGLAIAMGVNNIARVLRGPVIFASLLPFIVTPLVGSLILFWMTGNDVGDGLLFSLINKLAFWTSDEFSLRASWQSAWAMVAVYGVWHVTPFAFIVFYAGLQTVSQDQIEAAMVDGASPWERLINVIVPHLMPLITFVVLIHIMDAFRVLEPLVSFRTGTKAQSLSTLIYEHLVIQSDKRYGTAAATSLLTIFMVFILLFPVLVRTWKDFKGARA